MADGRKARLDSWKEIAAYLGRDVTTVRRWEKHEGLPVHRHLHRRLGSVFAYRTEIDAWSGSREAPLVSHDAAPAELAADSDLTQPLEPVPNQAGRLGLTSRLAAVLIAALLTGTSLTHPRGQPPPVTDPSPLRIAVAAPAGAIVNSLALAPDGEQVAFAATTADAGAELWIRRLDSVDAQNLPGTAGAAFPFWSADGQSVGFFADGKLKRIGLSTRDVRELADAPDGRGGAWNADDIIVFAPDRDAPLVSVPAAGGAITPRTRIRTPGVGGHAWPEFLPDGRHFLYLDYTHDRDQHGIHVGDLQTGADRRLLPIWSSASYATGGYLVYLGKTLMAQRFDVKKLELSGKAVSIGREVLQHYGLAQKADFSTSSSGVLAVRQGANDRFKLVWLDRAGREVQVFGSTVWYSNPTLSPDGRRAVVTVWDDGESASLWHLDLETGAYSRFTFADKVDWAPVWSPNAERVIFASMRGGRNRLYERRIGEPTDKLLLAPENMTAPDSWSRRGGYLTLNVLHEATKFDVWAWSPAVDREPFPVLHGDYNEGQSQISPDGRFVAYVSDETGRFEVYVRSFPEPGRKWQVSAAGGFDPRWRGDGRELFYIAADGQMTAVDVRTDGTFARGRARALFPTGLYDLWQDMRNHYDVSPDGARFLMAQPEVDPRTLPFTIVVNRRAGLPGGN